LRDRKISLLPQNLLEAVGELDLKGFRRPVPAFNVCKLQS